MGQLIGPALVGVTAHKSKKCQQKSTTKGQHNEYRLGNERNHNYLLWKKKTSAIICKYI